MVGEVFPAPAFSVDPRSGVERRQHLYEERLQRALNKAVALGGYLQAGFRAQTAPQFPPPAVGRHR